jgi:hypothetical protein
MTTPLTAPLVQFVRPREAYLALAGKGAWAAVGGASALILVAGFSALAGTPFFSWLLPASILVERALLSAVGGAALWGLCMAVGERRPLIPAMMAVFMAMSAWAAMTVFLWLVSGMAGLPAWFNWSPAPLVWLLPPGRTALFMFSFLADLDIPSIAAIFILGNGLSAVWSIGRSTGARLVWAVYLCAIILRAVTVP